MKFSPAEAFTNQEVMETRTKIQLKKLEEQEEASHYSSSNTKQHKQNLESGETEEEIPEPIAIVIPLREEKAIEGKRIK